MHHFYSLTAYIYHQVNWKPQWSHSLRGTLTFQQKAALPTLTVITVEVTSWEEERANSLRAARRQKMNSSMCLSHACRWFQQWLSVLRIYNCHCAAAQGTNSQIEGEAWNITVIGDSLSVSHQPIMPPTQQERWGTHTFTHTHTHKTAPHWCAHSAEFPLTSDVYCGMSTMSPPLHMLSTCSQKTCKKNLSHAQNCGFSPQRAHSAGSSSKQQDTQKHHRRLVHT